MNARLKTNTEKATVSCWLRNAAASLEATSDSFGLDAQVLLAHVLNMDRTWLLAHPDFQLTYEQLVSADDLLSRVISGLPLPYAIGSWDFFGMRFTVTPDVLIPRPETELLVEHAITWLKNHQAPALVADVGTGSGCVAISIARSFSDCRCIASDISEKALQVAHQNISNFGLTDRITLLKADLLTGINERFDLIYANLPYIPTEHLNDLAAAKVEPILALDGGQDGLRLINKLLSQSRTRLNEDGCILMEIDSTHAEKVLAIAKSLYPRKIVRIISDLAHQPRVLEIV